MRQVHREITETLSKNESFEFLQHVKLNDVKKVWKKAVAESAAAQRQDGPNNSNDSDKIWKLYTVGNGSVKTLAQEYSQATAKAIAAQELEAQEEQQALMENYVHVFLDVPADRSGSRPHQALINFNENSDKKSSGSTAESSNKKEDDARGEIFKIQVAAAPDGTKFPMLLYNQDRSMKTFIHPDVDAEDYDRVFNWITDAGKSGALGAAGGTKAYFYCRTTVRKHGPNVLSIDVRELAPVQSW